MYTSVMENRNINDFSQLQNTTKIIKLVLFFAISIIFLPPLLSAEKEEIAEVMREEKFEKIVQNEIDGKLFSGAQLAFFKNGRLIYKKQFGTISFKSSVKIEKGSLFDLASLTKPLVILPIYAFYASRGEISLEHMVGKYFPEIKQQVTIKDLLVHKSGFPAYETFFLKFKYKKKYSDRRDAIISYVADLKNRYPDNYSDINYILLGFILEKIFNSRVDTIFEQFLKDIDYSDNVPFFIGNSVNMKNVAATSYSYFRKRVSHAVVEDENCYFLFGKSGHAGLFASAVTTGEYLSFLIEKSWFKPYLKKAEGFDTPDDEDSSYGDKPKKRYRGHLGFSGTAFLIDYETGKVAVILVNRTHPKDDKAKLKERTREFRRKVFDLMMNE